MEIKLSLFFIYVYPTNGSTCGYLNIRFAIIVRYILQVVDPNRLFCDTINNKWNSYGSQWK